MGKHTYTRSAQVLFRTVTSVTLPVLGGLLFLVGSCFFWPTADGRFMIKTEGEWNGYVGAGLFLLGSVFYLSAPVIDYFEMTATMSTIQQPTEPQGSAPHYEWLNATQMLQQQRLNAILYAVGGTFFVAGSVCFFPVLRQETTHGAWLYLTGCVLMFLGAFLGMFSAFELRKTAGTATLAAPTHHPPVAPSSPHLDRRLILPTCTTTTTPSSPPSVSP